MLLRAASLALLLTLACGGASFARAADAQSSAASQLEAMANALDANDDASTGTDICRGSCECVVFLNAFQLVIVARCFTTALELY